MGDGNKEMQVMDWTPCVSHPNLVTPSRQLRPPHGPKHRNMQPGPWAQQIHRGSSPLVDPSGEGSSIPQPHGGFTSHSPGFKDILIALQEPLGKRELLMQLVKWMFSCLVDLKPMGGRDGS